MTPDDLARLKALAEAARDASDAYAHICATAPTWTDEASRLSDAEDDALEDLHEVATPAAILALIAAASPVPAGEFGERLEPVYGEPWACRKVSGAPPAIFHLERIVACVNACAGIADPAYFLAALTRSHATLLAERDAARAALSTMQKAAHEAFTHLDADRDAKALKMLHAMAGGLPGYRADIDAALTALEPTP